MYPIEPSVLFILNKYVEVKLKLLFAPPPLEVSPVARLVPIKLKGWGGWGCMFLCSAFFFWQYYSQARRGNTISIHENRSQEKRETLLNLLFIIYYTQRLVLFSYFNMLYLIKNYIFKTFISHNVLRGKIIFVGQQYVQGAVVIMSNLRRPTNILIGHNI